MTIHKRAVSKLINVNIKCKYIKDKQILWKNPSQNLILNAFIFKSSTITDSLHKWYSEGNLTHKQAHQDYGIFKLKKQSMVSEHNFREIF
jgi:hypothetical protein